MDKEKILQELCKLLEGKMKDGKCYFTINKKEYVLSIDDITKIKEKKREK